MHSVVKMEHGSCIKTASVANTVWLFMYGHSESNDSEIGFNVFPVSDHIDQGVKIPTFSIV